ncbi:FUSC family protein [Anoxybacteroides rupiense]|uniref:FUSC family protein n=1 Tax=Anoxybacteroides rupiense TaxID=311460 RepID=UPI001BACACAC|nr:aromatic acid exporter family protein [Anoxybacillus rupiensis]MBS2772557.1 aromatic acid exporter family protein [Anoxybacillus rupiensis]
MKLGARIFKTGIAVTLALVLASMLKLPAPSFAGISAVFAMQPTIYRSYLSLIEQLQANVIGAVFAIVFVLLFGHNPFIIGLTAILVIALCLRLRLESTISVALVTVIAVMEYTETNFIQFALIRFSTIMLGILAAFIVNCIFLPPKYEKKLYDSIVENTETILKWIRINTRRASEHHVLKEDIEKLKENMMKLNQLYLMYKEERIYFAKKRYQKSRKLVLYRQMITVTNRALDALRTLHRFENELSQMPPEFQQTLRSQLDCLLHYHEQILLKLVGKVKFQAESKIADEAYDEKKRLVEAFYQYSKHGNEYHLLSLVGTIITYGEQLEHLDKLVESFQQYHKDDEESLHLSGQQG